jgi:hypothetical protein
MRASLQTLSILLRDAQCRSTARRHLTKCRSTARRQCTLSATCGSNRSSPSPYSSASLAILSNTLRAASAPAASASEKRPILAPAAKFSVDNADAGEHAEHDSRAPELPADSGEAMAVPCSAAAMAAAMQARSLGLKVPTLRLSTCSRAAPSRAGCETERQQSTFCAPRHGDFDAQWHESPSLQAGDFVMMV